MSIENSLASIAKSLEIIASQMTKVTTVPAEHAPVTIPVAPAPAPVAPAAPAPAPAAPVVTVSPAVAPEPAPAPAPAAAGAVPFSDPKTMIQYVMDAYKQLGPQKGAKIQDVLKGIGHSNINEVRPDQYAALYAGIEGLK